MTERFDDRIRVARVVLETLAKGSLNWTSLMRLILKWSTPWKTQSTLDWLVREGYVERPERGIYVITEKGRRFHEAMP
jgi:predicted transcriptional regulator